METLAEIAASNGVTPTEWGEIEAALRPSVPALGGCAISCAGCPFAQQCHGEPASQLDENELPIKPGIIRGNSKTSRTASAKLFSSIFDHDKPSETAACSGCGKAIKGAGSILCKVCRSAQ